MLRRLSVLASLLLLGVPGATAQAADYPDSRGIDGWYRPLGHGSGWKRGHRHRHHASRYEEASVGVALAPRGRFFPGAGEAALYGPGVAVAEYSEAYLPRGVLYNVPGPASFARTAVIRAKY